MIRTLLTFFALGSTASAANTAAVHVFAPSGDTVPLGLSVTFPLKQFTSVQLALRGDLLLFPGLQVPPALSALVVAEAPVTPALIPYAGVGIGTASAHSAAGWTLHPTWTAVTGVRRTLDRGIGLSVEARASRAALGVAVGLTYQTPTGRPR